MAGLRPWMEQAPAPAAATVPAVPAQAAPAPAAKPWMEQEQGFWDWATSDKSLRSVDDWVASGHAGADVADVGRATLSGLYEGVTAAPGVVGDLEGLGRAGVNWIGGEGTVNPDPQFKTTGEIIDINRDLVKRGTAAIGIGGDDGIDTTYNPTTEVGQFTKNVASAVPLAVATGPGGVTRGLANAGRNVVTQAAAPVAAATATKYGLDKAREAGYQVPDWVDPVLETGAAMAGGYAATKGTNVAASRAKAARDARAGGTPAQLLKQQSDDLYTRIRANNIRPDADDVVARMATLEKEFEPIRGTLTPTETPGTLALIEKDLPNLSVSNPNIAQLNEARTKIRNVITNNMGPNGKKADMIAAQRLLERYDNALDTLDTAGKAPAELKEARRLWALQRRTEKVEDIAALAENSDNPARTITNEVRKITRDPTALKQYSKVEQQILKEIASRSSGLARWAKTAMTGAGGVVLGSALTPILGPWALAVGGAVGAGGREVVRAADDASKLSKLGNVVESVSAEALGRRPPVPRGNLPTKMTRGAVAAINAQDIIERWGNTYALNPETNKYELIKQGAR